jgi:AraC-like DNA-binding protein
LLMQNKTVHEVSQICGFANVSHYIKLFYQIKKCTPGKYLSGEVKYNDSPIPE